MRVKLIVALSAAVAAVLAAASPAAAAKPVVVVDEDFEELVVLPVEESRCGIEETVNQVGSVKITEFFDDDGNFVRDHIHVMGTTTTTEFGEVVDRWSWNGFLDPESLTDTQVGNIFNVHAGPGGVLVNDSGRIVIDLTNGDALAINGPHEAWFDEFDDACAVLTP